MSWCLVGSEMCIRDRAKNVTTITLSYTFFEVGSKTPAAPTAAVDVTPKGMGA
jgi:cytochrome c oxidase assembly protein subunit 11